MYIRMYICMNIIHICVYMNIIHIIHFIHSNMLYTFIVLAYSYLVSTHHWEARSLTGSCWLGKGGRTAWPWSRCFPAGIVGRQRRRVTMGCRWEGVWWRWKTTTEGRGGLGWHEVRIFFPPLLKHWFWMQVGEVIQQKKSQNLGLHVEILDGILCKAKQVRQKKEAVA